MSRLLKFVFACSLVVLVPGALACLLPHHLMPVTQPKMGAGDWVSPAVSGTWFDPARSGEGILVELLPNGTAIGTWFTYPPAGEDADQAWLSLQNGVVTGDTIRFPDVFRPRGTSFGAGFNPNDVVLERWGTLEMRFVDCNTAALTYAGPAAYGSGSRTLVRLTTLDELECSGTKDLTPTGARALTGLRARSGVWFVPSRSGEGWFIEELPNGNAVFFWFTFTPDGKQAWTSGVATRNGNRLESSETIITRGTRFGSAFSANDVQRIPWGRLNFEFSDCNTATASYASTIAGYGNGTRQSTRITLPASAVCIDGTPVVKVNGTWRAEPSTPPAPQSEHAAAVLGNRIYIAGGFGDLRGFKRFDSSTNTWTELPDLPGGRDHLASFALDGRIYVSGGQLEPGHNPSPGFVFDEAVGQWRAVPALPYNIGSQAAVLNGRAYIGNEDGSLVEFDARTETSRYIAPPTDGLQRDHAQVVAFLGEVWVLAGRFPENPSTAIYDPASQRWRAGPSLRRARGGFAAAVVDDQIVAGGGEILSSSPFRVEPTVEVYTAGGALWSFGPNLPVPVHGVTGSSLGGRFYVIGGARQAGTAGGAEGRMFSIQPVP